MAYVALGRSKELKDIFIKGKLDRNGIRASPEALEESKRLQKIFDENMEKLKQLKEMFFKVRCPFQRRFRNEAALRRQDRERVHKQQN